MPWSYIDIIFHLVLGLLDNLLNDAVSLELFPCNFLENSQTMWISSVFLPFLQKTEEHVWGSWQALHGHFKGQSWRLAGVYELTATSIGAIAIFFEFNADSGSVSGGNMIFVSDLGISMGKVTLS